MRTRTHAHALTYTPESIDLALVTLLLEHARPLEFYSSHFPVQATCKYNVTMKMLFLLVAHWYEQKVLKA